MIIFLIKEEIRKLKPLERKTDHHLRFICVFYGEFTFFSLKHQIFWENVSIERTNYH